MNTPIEDYEVHSFYPTRFFRWLRTGLAYTSHGEPYTALPPEKTLQQKWRNFRGAEQWRDIPEVLIEPNVTVEEVPETNQVLNDKNLATLL
jgi:hypothetical protein